jgi:hypothetical protein
MTIVSRFTPSAYLLDSGSIPTRSYTNWNGMSYIQLDNSVTASAGTAFYLEVEGRFNPSGFYLSGVKAATYIDPSNRLVFTSSGQLYFKSDLVVTASASNWAILTNGLTHTLKISRSEIGKFDLYVDGVLDGTENATYNTTSITLDSFFAKPAISSSVPYFIGYGYNIDFNGIHKWSLGEAYGTTTAYASLGGINGTYINRTSSDVTTTEPA